MSGKMCNNLKSNKEEVMYNILNHNDILDEEISENDNAEIAAFCTDNHLTAPVAAALNIGVPTISK